MKLQDEYDELYERWLMDNYPDEVRNKDDLIDKVCEGHRYDEFLKELKKCM